MNNGNMNPQDNQQQFVQQPMPQKPSDGHGFSIASLVVGICSVLFFWVGGLNIVLLACGIVAIILGNKGRQMSIAVNGKASGLATAGFVLGIIGTVFAGIGVVSCLACVGCASCAEAAMMESLF